MLNGNDLIKLGYPPNSLYSVILNDIENQQLNGILKTKEQAILYALEIYPKDEYCVHNPLVPL